MNKTEIIEALQGESINSQKHMKAEQELLLSEIREMNTFIYSDEGRQLDDNDKNCIRRQINAMDQYLNILDIRIYNAEADEKAKAEIARKVKAKAEVGNSPKAN